MHIGVITLFPEMFEILRCGGVTARALQRNILQLTTWNLRAFSTHKQRRVDDRPYGGGPGMVIQVQPLRTAIKTAVTELGADVHVIYLSPQGRRLDQRGVKTLLKHTKLLLIAGRYEGIDERIIERDIDEEWSIGDYVLSGGELPAMVIIDALARWLPDVLGHTESAEGDSFSHGLLNSPQYTRPEQIDGQNVPTLLLNGHHAEIARWRQKQALGNTWRKRPDLLQTAQLTTQQQILLTEFINEQHRGDQQ
jgi:tRNA (guanine37-N1)-methyltransferase